jgi:hypothetical protein
MNPKLRHLSLAAIAVAAISIGVHAQKAQPRDIDSLRAPSADIPPGSAQRRLLARASDIEGVAAKKAVTDEEVGDSDSFGRNVIWLGLAARNVLLADTCPVPGYDPDSRCVVLNAAPAATRIELEDIARVKLPGKSAKSLLCYWFSPFLNIRYYNPTGSSVVARVVYSPTLTVENPVLDDPGLIDAATGLPFNGSLLTGMTSSERFEVPLDPGQVLNSRSRDSAVCIAGFISRKALMLNHGLTDHQAKEFFKKPTVVRLNVTGSTQFVSNAQLYFALRIVGD